MLYIVNPYIIEIAMKWRVRLMRKAGRRIPWNILINEPGQVGTIRTQVCNYGSQGPYSVAVLSGDSVTASVLELLEPQLHMMGDHAPKKCDSPCSPMEAGYGYETC